MSEHLSAEVCDIRERERMNWPTIIALVLIHVGALPRCLCSVGMRYAAAVFLLWMATGLGISLGYHRLHTHRSYKCRCGWNIFSPSAAR